MGRLQSLAAHSVSRFSHPWSESLRTHIWIQKWTRFRSAHTSFGLALQQAWPTASVRQIRSRSSQKRNFVTVAASCSSGSKRSFSVEQCHLQFALYFDVLLGPESSRRRRAIASPSGGMAIWLLAQAVEMEDVPCCHKAPGQRG